MAYDARGKSQVTPGEKNPRNPTTRGPHFDPARLVAAMAPMSLRAVARRLEVDPAVLCRPLSAGQADRFATKLALHPIEVWGAVWSRPERRT